MFWDNTYMFGFFSEYDRFTTEKFCENVFVIPSIIYNCFFERRRSETSRLSMNKGASAKIMGSQGKSEKFPNY